MDHMLAKDHCAAEGLERQDRSSTIFSKKWLISQPLKVSSTLHFAPIPTEILCNIEVLNVVLKQVSRKKVKLRYKYNTHFHIFLTQYNPSMKPIASSPRQLYWYIWLDVFCGNVLGWIECPKCVASTLFSLYQKHTGLWTIFWAMETPVPDSSSHISSHARALCYQYAPLLGVYKSDPKEKSISSAIWTLSQMG